MTKQRIFSFGLYSFNPKFLFFKVNNNNIDKINGRSFLIKSGDVKVKVQAPKKEPIKELIAAKSSNFFGRETLLTYCVAATKVPPIAESLLMPNNVAGISLGYTENNAGNWTKPPPPTIASINPAKNAAKANTKKPKPIISFKIN